MMKFPPQPSEQELAKLTELLTLAGQMAPPVYTPEFMQKHMLQCTCGKTRALTPEMFFSTGLVLKDGTRVTAVEHLCPSCASSYKGTARLVCLGCSPRRVIARIAPGKDPRTGLEFRVDRCYHATACPVCQPTAGKSQMVEQMVMLSRQSKRA
jgi:hypothetical protein